MKRILMGNHALSYGAKVSRVEVIAAYPITPQTEVVELLSEMCANGELKAKFINVESEHSAMVACIGASATGARAFTATSAHGLALMHEVLHWAAGARLPIVMGNINRAFAPPWSIWAEQTDSIAQRDTGWMEIYASSNQEVLDSVIQGYKVSEQVLLPTMVILDAFVLSHTSEIVDIPDQEKVDRYLPPYETKYKLDPDDPHAFGGLTKPDWYYELRYKIEKAMEQAREVIKAAGKEFEEMFGRYYGLIEEYKAQDAEIILVASSTIASTARVVIDQLREEGKKVGLVRIRTLRPFPSNELREILPNAKKVAVIDRNISFGHSGVFYSETKSALYNVPNHPPIWGYIAGLGGRDVTVNDIRGILENTEREDWPNDDIYWVGAKI